MKCSQYSLNASWRSRWLQLGAALWFGLWLGDAASAEANPADDARLAKVAHLQLPGATLTQVELVSTETFDLPDSTFQSPD